MGVRSSLTNPSSKILAVGVFLQILILAAYFTSRKFSNTIEMSNSVSQLKSDLYKQILSIRAIDSSEDDPLTEYKKVQSERVNQLREYCADNKYELIKGYPKYDRLSDVLPRWNWLTSPYHHLFYCATPKCASTTWKTRIMKDLKLNWTIDVHQAATNLGVATMFPKKMPTFKDFLEFYRPNNRFIIVRNPWSRLVSAYEDKVVQHSWTLKKLCVAYDKYKSSEDITFDVFIDCLTHSDRDVVWNPHLNPLTSLCGVCQMDYNMIVKLEEMSEAEPYIFQALNFTTQTSSRSSLENKGKYMKTYSSHYENISKENIQLLHEIYRADIELFGYPHSPLD